MNREDIIRIATSAGIDVSIAESNIKILEKFAASVAAHEREECANLCEDNYEDAILCANAIRKRGE